jgi:drug/metabolite transporter (DMT)-like permease
MDTAYAATEFVRHGNLDGVTSKSRLPWMALGVVYVLWGSTYLANRFVLSSVPPLLIGGYRFLAGGALLAVILLCVAGRAALRMTRAEFATTALSGLLLPAWGNGMVVFAQQGVSSGLAALLIAAVPLWIVLLRALTGDRPRIATVAGVAVGVAGLAVLVLAGPASGGVHGTTWWGPWLVLLASLGWATGTFATTRLPVPPNPLALAAVQMVTGGLILLALGTALGERLDVATVTTSAWVAWTYLSMIVTLGAFSAYALALASLPVSTVATYAYVNPVIAVGLGAFVVGERFTALQLGGAAVVLLAVVLVVSAERPARKRPGAVAASPA